MNKQDIKLEIEGKAFVVDVKYAELRQHDRPLNIIGFSDMDDKGSHYTFSFDRKNPGLATIMSMDEDIVQVTVPQMIALDPAAVAEKYGIAVDALPAKDSDLIANSRFLNERLSGALPKIQIGDRMYFVDERLMELRATDNASDIIDLKSLDQSMDGKYLALYNERSQQPVAWDDDKTTQLPEHTKMLVIPSEAWLDPVGVARRYGLDQQELLMKYPVQAVHKAELYPLSMTGFPKKMEENRQKLAVKPNKQKVKRKKGLRP
jgi:hypothetical protein